MRVPSELYRPSLALLTDLYELTMAYACWKTGGAGQEAVFNQQFRRLPFGGGYAIAAGLEYVIDYLEHWHFAPEDLAYLAELRGSDGKQLFEPGFLEYLETMRFSCDVDAIPEGTAVFPYEPLLRIQGPVIQAQILETVLLNIINFQTLVATKAARICWAARGAPVLEFGLRRAHGIDGAIAASRASYVGGCAATSNVLAGRLFGIPVRGTHAHSWVMLFDDELESFDRYAEAMPNNCIFLVDTYDTATGVEHAVEVGRRLREKGHEMIGVRLDSGDLAGLSLQARRLLDEGGFPKAAVVASNDLDEYLIEDLLKRGAPIGIWGVGTKLVTAYDEPALGGVYKLAAVRRPGEEWSYRIKLSEQTAKISDPGILQVRRFETGEGFLADVLYDCHAGPIGNFVIADEAGERALVIEPSSSHEDLLVPVFRAGKRVYSPPPLAEVRARTATQVSRLPEALRKLQAEARYTVALEKSYHDRKTSLARRARDAGGASSGKSSVPTPASVGSARPEDGRKRL